MQKDEVQRGQRSESVASKGLTWKRGRGGGGGEEERGGDRKGTHGQFTV